MDLLTKMLTFNPKDRIDINGIKQHAWMQGTTLKQKELIAEIRDRHRKAEKKRRQDVRKMEDLANSINPQKPIPGVENAPLLMWPKDEVECMFGEVYTYLKPKQKWYDLLNLIEEAVSARGGTYDFNKSTGLLTCRMRMNHKGTEQNLGFSVQIFESRLWKNKYKELDEAEEIEEAGNHQIFITQIKRTEGDRDLFKNVKNQFLLLYCAEILKGLPVWAQNMEKEEIGDEAQDEEEEQKEDAAADAEKDEAADEQKVKEEEDEYDAVLQKEAIWKENDQKEMESVVNGGQ